MTTLSAGLALGGAQLVFGQKRRPPGEGSTRPIDGPVPRPLDTRKLKPIDTFGGHQIPIQAQQDALFYFTQSTFDPYVGDIFQSPNARGQMVTLKLVNVSGYKASPTTKIATKKTKQPTSFTLTFKAESRLPQFTSIYKISHPALGEFDIFLTPSQAQDGTWVYEAVFNHL
jgi:hypothetical protein